MKHEDIVNLIARSAELPTRRRAEQAMRAVLETLAEQVGASAARGLAERLPLETSVYLHDVTAPSHHPSRDVDGFLDRVGGRLAVTRPDAIRISRAVISIVTLVAGEDRTKELRESLPPSWRDIFEHRRFYPIPPAPPPA